MLEVFHEPGPVEIADVDLSPAVQRERGELADLTGLIQRELLPARRAGAARGAGGVLEVAVADVEWLMCTRPSEGLTAIEV